VSSTDKENGWSFAIFERDIGPSMCSPSPVIGGVPKNWIAGIFARLSRSKEMETVADIGELYELLKPKERLLQEFP